MLALEVEKLDVTSRDVFLDSLRTRSGYLTRPTDLRREWSIVSRVECRNGKIIWTAEKLKRLGDTLYRDAELPRRSIEARRQGESSGRRILDEFVTLCEADDKKLLDFARTWGVLELCHHCLPYRHIPMSKMPGVSGNPWMRLPEASFRQRKESQARRLRSEICCATRIEPLESWRFFSAQGRAMLGIAANLRMEQLGEVSDWAMVLRDRVFPQNALEAHQACLQDCLECWLNLGTVRPRIDAMSQGITWGGADLFGELAVQISLACIGAKGQVFCVECGKPYVPKKRVEKGTVHYCPNARCQKVAAARRSARSRSKKRDIDQRGNDRGARWRGPYGSLTNDPLFS